MSRLPLAAALALSACASSAPHTLGAAAIHSGLALGMSAAERGVGGCYATCAHGTVCNPNTGFCEREDVAAARGAACTPGEVCPVAAISGTQSPHAAARPIGISPATGTVPSLPPATSLPSPQAP